MMPSATIKLTRMGSLEDFEEEALFLEYEFVFLFRAMPLVLVFQGVYLSCGERYTPRNALCVSLFSFGLRIFAQQQRLFGSTLATLFEKSV